MLFTIISLLISYIGHVHAIRPNNLRALTECGLHPYIRCEGGAGVMVRFCYLCSATPSHDNLPQFQIVNNVGPGMGGGILNFYQQIGVDCPAAVPSLFQANHGILPPGAAGREIRARALANPANYHAVNIGPNPGDYQIQWAGYCPNGRPSPLQQEQRTAAHQSPNPHFNLRRSVRNSEPNAGGGEGLVAFPNPCQNHGFTVFNVCRYRLTACNERPGAVAPVAVVNQQPVRKFAMDMNQAHVATSGDQLNIYSGQDFESQNEDGIVAINPNIEQGYWLQWLIVFVCFVLLLIFCGVTVILSFVCGIFYERKFNKKLSLNNEVDHTYQQEQV
eukprot:467314_1